jgi:hypothetical protein
MCEDVIKLNVAYIAGKKISCFMVELFLASDKRCQQIFKYGGGSLRRSADLFDSQEKPDMLVLHYLIKRVSFVRRTCAVYALICMMLLFMLMPFIAEVDRLFPRQDVSSTHPF